MAGYGQDASCDGAAFLCALDFPTGLLAHEGFLYIADSGSGRVLKMSEPEVKAGLLGPLRLEFSLSADTQMDKLVLEGNFSEESYDAQQSNLVGLQYDPTLKTFTNLRGSTYQNQLCKLGPDLFTQDNLIAQGLKAGDILTLGETDYTVEEWLGETDCDPDEEAEDLAFRIRVSPNVQASSGKVFYGKSPESLVLAFSGIRFEDDGFEELTVSRYTVGNDTPQESQTLELRVGDGLLGTREDTMEVFAQGLRYPTGLAASNGQLRVAESLPRKVQRFFLESGEPAGSPLDLPLSEEDDFEPADLVSPFAAEEFALGYANGLLSLSFRAALAEGKSQSHQLSVALPPLIPQP